MERPEALSRIKEVSSTIQCDNIWRVFGYQGAPGFVSTILGKFGPKWKRDLVVRIIRELAVTSFALEFLIEKNQYREIEYVLELFFQFGGTTLGLGYKSPSEAQADMAKSILRYLESPLDKWEQVLVQRLGTENLPSVEVQGNILIGSVQYATMMRSVVRKRLALTESE